MEHNHRGLVQIIFPFFLWVMAVGSSCSSSREDPMIMVNTTSSGATLASVPNGPFDRLCDGGILSPPVGFSGSPTTRDGANQVRFSHTDILLRQAV